MDDRRAGFYEVLRQSGLLGSHLGQPQVDGLENLFSAWDQFEPKADPRKVAYCLGTVLREAGAEFQPRDELGRGHGRAYGNPVDGKVYFGRGLIQLTWKANYAHAEARLGSRGMAVPLVQQPELANRPEVASAIAVLGMSEGWFTGRKLGDYFVGTRSDWVDARAIINGHDHAALVAHYSLGFYHALLEGASA